MVALPPQGFIRAYHLTKLEHAISNIRLRRLKVATFSDANDPFELMALNLRGSENRGARKVLRQFKEAQRTQLGMLCFSRHWENPVLWSHYADGHKGVCLGFDVAEDVLDEVTYVDDLLTARLGDEDDPSCIPQDLQDFLFLTKFRHWAYENEVRRFVALPDAEQTGPLFFWPFDERMRLREVILGHLCAPSHLEPIRNLAVHANVDAVVLKARLSFGSFKVRPNERYPPMSPTSRT
jgi:hypothetical protein